MGKNLDFIDPDETKKTIIFIIIDTIFVLLFSYFWFKYVDEHKNAVSESLSFVICMNTLFAIYYYTFDKIWDWYYKCE